MLDARRRCRTTLAKLNRLRTLTTLSVGGLVLLAACTGAPVPATIWLRLPAQPPGQPAAQATTSAAMPAAAAPTSATAPAVAAAPEVWQLMQPLPMPANLDRETLFVPQGAANSLVRPLAGARWVEPLRDAVPRLLREDLVQRLGGQPLWVAPLPPGVVPTRQLRVEIVAFEIDADGKTLLTRARWSLADARGGRAPSVHEATLGTPAGSATDAEAWAVAHRLAIAALAARIAATLVSPATP